MNSDQKVTNNVSGRLAAQLVRTEMARRGLDLGQLAAACGIGGRTLSARISEGLGDDALRLKLEAAFLWEISLISDSTTLAFRRRCSRSLGFDPHVLNLPDLRRQAARLQVRDLSTSDTREAVLDKLAAHLAANPTLLK
jgi:hypothetical protein